MLYNKKIKHTIFRARGKNKYSQNHVCLFLDMKLYCEAAHSLPVASFESGVDNPNDSCTSKQSYLNTKLYHIIN